MKKTTKSAFLIWMNAVTTILKELLFLLTKGSAMIIYQFQNLDYTIDVNVDAILGLLWSYYGNGQRSLLSLGL